MDRRTRTYVDPLGSFKSHIKNLVVGAQPPSTCIAIGEVDDNVDNKNCRRLKVRVFPYDRGIKKENIKFAFPILPPHLIVTPRIGEFVIIFFENSALPYGSRFWIGPIIGSGEVDNQNFFEAYNAFLNTSFTTADMLKETEHFELDEPTTEGDPIE